MTQQPVEKFDSKFLLEGNDDLHVVWAICKRYNIPESFDVIQFGGIGNLLKQIPVRIKLRVPNLGILLDSDSNLQTRWNDIAKLLIPLGYQIPEKPILSGTILTSNDYNSRIGVWLMPNNSLNGMLEDFIRILIPEDDLLLPFVEKGMSEIEVSEAARYSDIHRAKAFIHTWLAWQESPGTPMGQAITKSYLDHNHELCIFFVDWLNRLFNPVLLEN